MTLRHSGHNDPVPLGMVIQGPLIKVTLAPSQLEVDATLKAGGIPKTITHNLLVDTGAQSTCVEDKIPQALGLVPIRFTQMMGVSGKPEDYPVYRMTVIFGMKEDGTTTVHPATFSAEVVGSPSPAMPLTHIGLLGRDFLQYVRLVYDGPKGDFELIDYKHVSARTPSRPPPPIAKGWKAIQSARKRSKKHRRR